MLYKHMQPAALTAKIALMHEWLQTFTKVLLTNNLLFDLRVCVWEGRGCQYMNMIFKSTGHLKIQ